MGKATKEVLKIIHQNSKNLNRGGGLDSASLTRVPVTRVLEL